MDESFAFAGSNAYRYNKIIPVKLLIQKLVEELTPILSAECF